MIFLKRKYGLLKLSWHFGQELRLCRLLLSFNAKLQFFSEALRRRCSYILIQEKDWENFPRLYLHNTAVNLEWQSAKKDIASHSTYSIDV